ncbi:LysR family transcriptional regulator [Pseudomonas sp. KFB-139]|uniref:LysR family transcriptional regulator n=1 Tax=Pseudomonas serbiensis TaxID=3064350 RepID=A0ABT9CMX3_9PSED|nr:LysR family transcriptional regulator [Pseudomonas sp. KFB-138]MDO7926851.1 LysR family transcriptional regulator [Pseudomonas sp. KFB-138]
MSFTFRHIEIFKAIMVTGTVTGASLALETSQPTVSRELSKFEESVGMRLFERSKGRLKPTAQGMALHSEILKTYEGLARINAAIQSIKLGVREKVNIISLPVLSQTILPASLARFIECYPDINLSLTTHDSPDIEPLLSSQAYDVGLIEGMVAPMGTTLEHLMDVNEVCILPPGHPLSTEPVIDPRLLSSYPFVHLAPNDPYRHQLDSVFAKLGVFRASIIEVDNAAVICQMVLNGIGISIINPLVANTYLSQGLVIRPLSISVPFSISIVRPQQPGASLIVDHLVDCIRITSNELSALVQPRNTSSIP